MTEITANIPIADAPPSRGQLLRHYIPLSQVGQTIDRLREVIGSAADEVRTFHTPGDSEPRLSYTVNPLSRKKSAAMGGIAGGLVDMVFAGMESVAQDDPAETSASVHYPYESLPHRLASDRLLYALSDLALSSEESEDQADHESDEGIVVTADMLEYSPDSVKSAGDMFAERLQLRSFLHQNFAGTASQFGMEAYAPIVRPLLEFRNNNMPFGFTFQVDRVVNLAD